MLIAGMMNILYSFTVVRWVIILAYIGVLVYFTLRYKEQLKKLFLKKRAAS